MQFVEEQFNAVFDNQVEEVHMCYNTRELDKLVSEYNSTFTKLQDQIDEYIRMDKLRKKMKPQKVRVLPSCSLDNYSSQMHSLRKIYPSRKPAESHKPEPI